MYCHTRCNLYNRRLRCQFWRRLLLFCSYIWANHLHLLDCNGRSFDNFRPTSIKFLAINVIDEPVSTKYSTDIPWTSAMLVVNKIVIAKWCCPYIDRCWHCTLTHIQHLAILHTSFLTISTIFDKTVMHLIGIREVERYMDLCRTPGL